MVDKYIGNFPKLSVVNSLCVNNIVIYHCLEKNCRVYYRYDTKEKLGISFESNNDKIKVGLNKEEFIKFLEERL